MIADEVAMGDSRRQQRTVESKRKESAYFTQTWLWAQVQRARGLLQMWLLHKVKEHNTSVTMSADSRTYRKTNVSGGKQPISHEMMKVIL